MACVGNGIHNVVTHLLYVQPVFNYNRVTVILWENMSVSKRNKQIKKQSNGSNGHAAKVVPQAKVRARVENPAPSSGMRSLPEGELEGRAGRSERPAGVPPVKVRVGGTGLLVGDGATEAGRRTGRLVLDDPALSSAAAGRATTSHLRESDLLGMRFRLGQGPPMTPASSSRSSVHSRALPYFLMRHRAVRAGARVGHTRSRVARKRYGNKGGLVLALRLSMALWMLLLLLFGAGIGAGVAGAGLYISQLPSIAPAALSKNNFGLAVQTTKIYDRNGILLSDLVDEDTGRREELSLDQIAPVVISATVAAEDSSFYSNSGVDPLAIVRALAITLRGNGQSGASTITQQLVRQVVLSPAESQERSLNRKIKEATLAVEMAQTYSKSEIMEMFLNQNYYGHRAYGIGAAALTYFGKPAKDLTLSEASLLAGLPQAPSEFDPLLHGEAAKRRQAYVLDQMAKQNMITPEQAQAAKNEDVALKPYKPVLKAPHFVYYVKEYLEKIYPPQAIESGLKVYTTLDLNLQETAQKVAHDRITELRQQNATNAAIVIMKPNTGEILAMVGSVDYNDPKIDGQVNVATRERQPGSSFKPITYVTAFEQGWTPGTVVLDTLTSFPNPGQKPYIPYNYDKRDHGWVTVRESLGNSFNIPAVKALQFAGIQNTIDTAHDMGIKGLNRGLGWYGLSLTLGGGEVTLLDMTNAYSTFANKGAEMDANPIMRIEDAQGRTIYQLDPNAKGAQVMDPRYAYMITSIMSDNSARAREFGTTSPLKTSFQSAAKTGTTNDNRDSWTLGYTPSLTVGVWVGNSNNAEMRSVTGAIGAAVIWHNMIEKFYSTPEFADLVRGPDGTFQSEFVQPEGLIKAYACSAKGDVYDLFLKEAPPKGCTTYKDKNQQLHAAPSTTSPNATPNPNPNPKPKPQVRPTPLPGIGPPDFGSNP